MGMFSTMLFSYGKQDMPTCFIFMPPTLKKLEGHIAIGLLVCVCVCVWVDVCARTSVSQFFETSEWCMLGI